jgi:hypothetical protein
MTVLMFIVELDEAKSAIQSVLARVSMKRQQYAKLLVWMRTFEMKSQGKQSPRKTYGNSLCDIFLKGGRGPLSTIVFGFQREVPFSKCVIVPYFGKIFGRKGGDPIIVELQFLYTLRNFCTSADSFLAFPPLCWKPSLMMSITLLLTYSTDFLT